MRKRLTGMLVVAVVLAAVESGRGQETASPLESKFLTHVRQVTNGFEKAGEGYFSPDGNTIIYQATRAEYPFYQIYMQSLDGGTPQQISTGRGRTTCSYFSPAGQRLLFASSHLDPQLDQTEAAAIRQIEEDRRSGVRRRYQWDFDPHMDLFESDLEGNILRRLTTTPGYDAEGAWSADGRFIAFCSDRDGDPDLYVMDADGGGLRQVTHANGYDGGPFISPDGAWIVFRSDRLRAEYLQIYVVPFEGGEPTQLTNSEGVNWGPYWHPTEPYLIWSGADHSNPQARPNYDLWLMKFTVSGGVFRGSDPVRVTDFAGADVLPVFSPDGKRLMWTSTRAPGGESQLFLADFRLP